MIDWGLFLGSLVPTAGVAWFFINRGLSATEDCEMYHNRSLQAVAACDGRLREFLARVGRQANLRTMPPPVRKVVLESPIYNADRLLESLSTGAFSTTLTEVTTITSRVMKIRHLPTRIARSRQACGVSASVGGVATVLVIIGAADDQITMSAAQHAVASLCALFFGAVSGVGYVYDRIKVGQLLRLAREAER